SLSAVHMMRRYDKSHECFIRSVHLFRFLTVLHPCLKALKTSLLFSKEFGLLSFLRKSLASEELRDTRVEIICFLEKFLEKIRTRDMCMVLYTKDKGAKCRTPALELLIKVVFVFIIFKVCEIFNRYYGELCQRNKVADSVLGKIYELLGVLGDVHPSEMVNNSDKLYKAYLGELKEQMTSSTKEPKLIVVAGCLRGITALMVNFTKTMEEDPATSKEIFQYALKTISPQVNDLETIYSVYCTAGLKLIGRHASQFRNCLIDHYRALFEVMCKLCGHINGEMKKTSYYALESFLKQVAILVAENIEEHKSKLKYFMQKFCSIIKTMDSSYKELSIAIRGYGFFAAPCKKVCPQDVELMYTELIQRCKQMYLTESDGEEDSLYQLPSFLDSIASVIIHLDKVIPEVYTPLLECLLVVQIDSFPQHSEKMQTACCRSILKVLVAMASKGPVLWSFISSVVHQGLIRVCSKPIMLSEDSNQIRTGKWKVPSSQDYLDLYKNLLDCDQLKDSGFLDGAFESQNSALASLSRLLYDDVIKSIVCIVEKLDLSVQKVTAAEEGHDDVSCVVLPSSDPTSHLMPSKVKDFTAFINLVDFCSELLLNKHMEYFQPWIFPLSHELILHSIRNPLVSGFYKLLAVSMKIANRIQYFQVMSTPLKFLTSETVKSACFALISKFGKEVCVRMKQYKDELLASCLMFVLSLHHSIVALDIKAYCPALEAALKLGLSHVPLANTALDALECWSSHIPLETMQPCYRNILPLLDGYLKTAANEKDQSSWEVTSSSSSRSERGYNQVMTRLLKHSAVCLSSVWQDTWISVEMLAVVDDVLLFFCLAVSTEEMMKKFVAWDSEKKLSFAVPFTDMKPVIYLDVFLPRISELALSKSDRQTKVAACELLHSLVIYMIGKSAQMAEGENRFPPMYCLHKRLFPVLLHLACDVDQVTRQLFEPLVMQLIHWFTSNKKFESQDTVAVLEAILDGAVDPMDSTLRDFCGRCTEEFVKWSIKQTTPEQQDKSPANIKSLFKRIYSLALHPNGFKRLGAALVFNSIYRQFREESSLVDQFVFEVLIVFVESLALAHSDEPSIGTLQQCGSAIDHLKRIIKYKAPSLNQHNARRRIPRGFPPEEKLCLSHVVLWLLEQCGRPQAECRHKCMELFYEFIPLLPGNKSPSQWLEVVLEERSMGFLISQFEGGGLLSQSTLRDLLGPFSVRATIQWMDLLLAALDCYNTFISLHIIKPHYILEKPSFLKAVGFFLTELATHGLEAAESCFPMGQQTSHFSPREIDQYNYSKCTIIVRLMEFTTMILVKCDEHMWKLLEQDVFGSVFFELTALVVCQPSAVGFNMADVQVMKCLPEVSVPLMKALLASPYHTSLENMLFSDILSVEELCKLDLYHTGSLSKHEQMEMILSACQQIHKAGLLSSVLHSQTLGCQVLMAVYKGIAPGERKALPSLDINSRRLADSLLQLAFSLSQKLVELLLNTIMLSVPLSGSHSQNFLSFSHGEYFYSLFQMTINSELLRNLNSTVPQLLQAASLNPSMVGVLLNGMLDHTFRERSVRKTEGSRLVELVLRRWDSLQPWWNGHSSTPESKTTTLLLLSKLFQALLVLPFFTGLPDELLAELQAALEALAASHFPMQSNEFSKGSLHRNNYMDCMRKLLDALELSQSPLLLKLLAGVLCRDTKHIMEEQFQTCFQRIAQRSVNPSSTGENSNVPVISMLQAMMERVLLPLASHCSSKALSDFFVANITDIMAVLLMRFTKASEAAFEAQLLKKSGCYKLMELLYSQLLKEEVYSKESRINQAYCHSEKTEGNELSKTLIKSCFEAFTENMAGESQLLEIRRRYHCAAYNCAINVISRSFSEPKFYQGFLFTEKPDKNQFIFENLIDVQRTYTFPIEIEVPLERKKKYIMIRRQANEENGDMPAYLSSQSYMADSSLSEEMSQFDFSTGVQSFSLSSQNPEAMIPFQDALVDLEMDELNQHECMAAMTALIGHMHRNNITPKVKTEQVSDLPAWMTFLHGKLMNPATALNIRLFITKLVINTEEVFRPYAKHWLGPLLQLVVSGNNGGEGIHFMVVDIVVTMLSWTSVASPKGNPRDEVLANRLLEFLMKHSFHPKRAVFRHNLEIIRTLVECWKDCLHVPYSVIYQHFCSSNPNSKDNSVGLQLLGIILANGFPAHDASCGIEYEKYIHSLTNNLSFTRYKEVYSAAAEIIGLILVAKHLYCIRADVIPNIFFQLKSKGFLQMLGHRDEARQRVCLDIIRKIVALLTPVELQEVLGGVTAFISHSSPVCRERMYDILMWIVDNYSDVDSMADSTSLQVLNAAKETLLQGLTEEHEGLQLYVHNFWSQEKRLPAATLERMLMVLGSLYSCQIERRYLSLATNLLLEMTSQSPDFSRNMFEYPLSECTFQDYVIDSSWRLRSTVMMPMFVETQSSQGPVSPVTSQVGTMKPQLRATQTSLEFTQTLTAGRRTAYNWLTGSNLDTLVEFTPPSESLSSLLAFGKKAERQATARRSAGEGFGIRRLSAATEEVDSRSRGHEQRADILRLRRRFLKDQVKVSMTFARKEIHEQKQRKEDKANKKFQKEAQVTLYRSYRVGDFPDIQIPYSSLIAPLQGLAQRDPILAKQLFSSLFAGILQEMEHHRSAGESQRIEEELRNDMNSFLNKSSLCFPPFVACVQDMCYQHKELLQLQPAAISSSCLLSLQQPSGILLLEEGLLHAGHQGEPLTKRSRGHKEIPPDTEKWIHLAKLYRSLEDYDVVRGIFSDKVGTKSITCTALLAEANMDYAEAVKLYNQALNTEHWSDGEPSDSEKDYWEIAAMEAYSQLTEWKSLQYFWSQPFTGFEMYLQHMIRSMLKQLQQGEKDQALLSFVDRAMRVEERKKLLETQYSQELSLLYILQEDYDRARYYANHAMQLFMQNYSSVDTLLNKSRLTILQSVQALTEIHDFLQFVKGEVSVASLKQLIRLWTNRYPDAKLDPMNVWDDIITSRCFFLDKIKEKLRSQSSGDSMEVERNPMDNADTLINDYKFDMKLCMADSARKQGNFPVATKLLKELHREAKTQRGWFLRWVHSFSRYSHKCSLAQDPVEQISTILKTVPLLGKQLALKLLCDAVRRADEELQSYSQDYMEISSITHTYMALTNFCDKLLRHEEQSNNVSEFPDLLTLPVHVVESLLKALRLNSEEARLRFPRLLQIIELYPSETLDLMTKEIMTVPCWMLIGWISQMVALLDKPESVAVQRCIGQIAECYPQALVYALMISSESYQFQDSTIGHQQQEFVLRLRNLLDKGGAVKKFVDALQQLTNPDMLFKDWWDDVKNELEKPNFDKKRMGCMYNEMRSSLGDQCTDGYGGFRKKFIRKFAKDVEALFGPQGSKLFEKRKNKSFLQQVDKLVNSMRGFQREPGNLKEYSPWLSGFTADLFCAELEIPGQYDGRSKPLPEYHAKITGFDERVKVMSSIRRPKRLIIRGDDEHDHPFLVKGGEDLRQDQRIEQLFGIMNILLSHDTACTHRSLQLCTYQVIPITTRNKIPLNCSAFGRRASRTETVNNFLKVTQLVPADLLRRAFLKMCTNPEAFLSLRSHFISSHALLCVSHWILGIGDRHLSNFMINMETGSMIGIDFGHAFGSATQFLPVPELMPFRLTRQFVNLMQPLKESGLIKSVMVNSLRAYRAEPSLLLCTMDVFVKEPSLDWKNFEMKQLKKGGTWTESINTKEISWYPLQKVNFAKRKLEGANPAAITRCDLQLGFEKDAAFKGMLAVALGTKEHNIRAKLPAEGLSVEKQVDCLLDQAMDPNLLGRVWQGWEPWV
uniref:DNA-dependent protein kinase catalytic subunit n=1 Tax=Myripristis murdjan TaxID=586833 RepID=A0A667XXZ0_9TELE